MKITTRGIIVPIFIIAIVINLGLLIFSIYSDPQFYERDGIRPGDGISIGHNDNVDLSNIAFYIVNTRETDSIEVRLVAKFLEPTAIGKVGIYFPYEVDLNSDELGWEKAEIESGTVFMKKYSCSEETFCITDFDEQPIFTLTPKNSKFDSKSRYNHGIKVKFDHTIPSDADNFFRDYNLQDNFPLEFSYDDSVKRRVTVIIPEKADNIHPIPIPDPDVFHNRGNDYSNTQLDWRLFKESHAFFVDYEIPDERKQFQTSQLYITLTGISMGIIIGLFGITLAILSSNRKTISSILKWPTKLEKEK